MWWLVVWVFLVQNGDSAAINNGQQCGASQLDRCLKPITDVTIDERLSFPVTETDLADTCSRLEIGDRCMQRFIHRCMTSSTSGMVTEMISGAKNVLRLLCHNRTVQNDYLRHAECFKRVALLNQCTPASPLPPVNSNSVLRKFCCQYKSTIECQLAGIRTGCHRSEQAVEFFQHYSREMSHSLLTEHCVSFTQKCQNSSGSQTIFLVTIFLSFIIGAIIQCG